MMTTCIEHPKDPVCQQELEHIAACGLDWNAFSHKTILVTGATGLVGSYAVRALAAINRIHNCRMTILAMVRSADKAQKIYGSLLERGDVALVIGDVRDPIVYDGAVDYIIHGASVTASKEMDHETTKHRVDRSIFGPHLYYFPIDLCNPAGHGFRNVPI